MEAGSRGANISPMSPMTRIGSWSVAALGAILSAGAGAALAAPGCPASPGSGSCTIHAQASRNAGYVLAGGFTPRSDVRFEIYASQGGARIYGPVTRKTDAAGQRNAPGNLDRLVPGNHIVVTDVASGTVKTLTLAPLTLDRVDYPGSTAAGTASPATAVEVVVLTALNGSPLLTTSTVSDAQGRWQVDLKAKGVTLAPGMNVTAEIADEDGDVTHAHGEPGCASGSGWCALLADTTNDVIGADGMTPNGDVRFEVFASKNGAQIFGPVTEHLERRGLVGRSRSRSRAAWISSRATTSSPAT